jgi:hypothetical protein
MALVTEGVSKGKAKTASVPKHCTMKVYVKCGSAFYISALQRPTNYTTSFSESVIKDEKKQNTKNTTLSTINFNAWREVILYKLISEVQ